MSYLGNSPGVASQMVPETAVVPAGGQSLFTPSSGYTLGYLRVFHNGIKLVNGDDFTASNGVSFTLTVAANAGDTVEWEALLPRGLSDGYMKAEADARYHRFDTASQGLTSTQQSNARTNIGAQAALGYTPVNNAGDTMTGVLQVNYAYGNGTPAQKWVGSGAEGFMHPTHSMTPNMAANNTVAHFMGKSADAKNAAYVGFKYSGTSGSDLNCGTLGLWSKDHALMWDGKGSIRMQYQPMFCGVASYGTSYSGNLDPINFNSQVYENTGSAYATSGANAGKYICPTDGRYFISAQGHVQNNGSYATIQIKKNGVVHSNAWQTGCSSEITSTALIYCSAGDQLYASMGTAQTNYISETYWTLTIMFMG